MKTRTPIVAFISLALILWLTTAATAQVSWSTAYANGSNHSFLPVTTAAAGRGSLPIPNLGAFATGVAPVTAADGTVYIANTAGKVYAFRANGTPAWSRDITRGQVVSASPAVTADGSIFVVGATVVRDHRGGKEITRRDLFLHKFTPGGGWNGPVRFPEQSATLLEQYQGSGATTAPLNVWRFGAAEALMIPVLYGAPGGAQLRVLAFSREGGFLGDAVVKQFRDVISAGDWFIPLLTPMPFKQGEEGPSAALPMPGVSIFSHAASETPFIMVSDNNHEIVGFKFELMGSAGKFTEHFRFRDDKGGLLAAPATSPAGHTMVGTKDGRLLFTGPTSTTRAAVTGIGSVYATPTVLPDGRVLAVGYSPGGSSLAVVRGDRVVSRTKLPSASVVSAAASNTHVYVATETALLTFETATMQQVQKFDWVGGGLWPPSIGPVPQSHVYAMVKNILLVFPPPTATTQPRMPPPAATGGGSVRDQRAPAPAPRDHR